MPRISAATVADHRRQMHEAILDAAQELLADAQDGDTSPPLTVGRIAERVGLGRTGIYRYFPDVDAIAEAVAVRDFPRWTAAVRAAVDAAPTPRERVAAYVRTNIALAHDHDHAWLVGMSLMHLSPAARARIGRLHVELTGILGEITGGHPHLTGTIQAIVNTGVAEKKADDWYESAALAVVGLVLPE